jgi:hypothetical protein
MAQWGSRGGSRVVRGGLRGSSSSLGVAFGWLGGDPK